jgi:hypothetical protein
MAMLSQSASIGVLGCPAGACREQVRAGGLRRSWKALSAGFAAGVSLMSAFAILAGGAAPEAAPPTAAQRAAASRYAELVRAQTPKVLPREWRQEIKRVDFDRMIAKPR